MCPAHLRELVIHGGITLLVVAHEEEYVEPNLDDGLKVLWWEFVHLLGRECAGVVVCVTEHFIDVLGAVEGCILLVLLGQLLEEEVHGEVPNYMLYDWVGFRQFTRLDE